MPEPYRVLFPIGVVYGIAGALLWLAHAAGQLPYPGPIHRALMIQGFELCFVAGFLLTALPGFLHAEKCRPLELWSATALLVGFGVFAVTRWFAFAQACFTLVVLVLVLAALRRLRRASQPPPMELLFAGIGLVLGLAGGITSLADAARWKPEPIPGFGIRLVSLGMVLSMVLGVGGLLVPTFTGVRQPLAIGRIAAPHEGAGRRPFYGLLVAMLVLSFGLESLGLRAAGALLRAAAATPMLLLVWKLTRPAGELPGWKPRERFTGTLRAAGWCVLAGLWLAALLPRWTLAAYHVLFIGGFGLLTLGIATRVVVAHGGHGGERELEVLNPVAVGGVLLALVARVAGELWTDAYLSLLAASGALWSIAWLAWGLRAIPLMILGRREPASHSGPTAAR